MFCRELKLNLHEAHNSLLKRGALCGMHSWQGLEDSVSSWFDGDSMQSFFEFQVKRVMP